MIAISKLSHEKQKERQRAKRRAEQETNYYLQIGVKSFDSTHTSAVEAIVLMREALEEANRT